MAFRQQTSGAAQDARVLLRLDAGGETGLGHVVRTSALLGLVTRPFDLTVIGTGDALAAHFPQARIVAHGGDGLAETAKLSRATQTDLFICDHPAAPQDIWQCARYRPHLPCVAIDDKGGRVDADLIVNGTVIGELQNYRDLRQGVVVLTGQRHTLVRPEFSRSLWKVGDGRANVVIAAGSGRRAADWVLMLLSGAVDMAHWGNVTLVVGTDFPEPTELRSRCLVSGVRLREGVGADELAELFSNATVALTTGGMIVYECVVVGVPAVVFPQIDNLVGECAWFAEQGCVTDLGFEGGFEAPSVQAAVDRLLADESLRLSRSAASRATMDGLGMQRAAAEISRLLDASVRKRDQA